MTRALAILALALGGCGDLLSAGKHELAVAPSSCGSVTTASEPTLTGGPRELTVTAPDNDGGTHLAVSWGELPAEGRTMVVLRREGAAAAIPALVCPVKPRDLLPGGWTVAYAGATETALDDEVLPGTYLYVAFEITPPAGHGAPWPRTVELATAPTATEIAAFNTDRWFYLAIVLLTGGSFFFYFQYAKRRAGDLFIRRIPGVDAIEDAIGRATEMGRPILYGTGMEDIQDIQTVASLLILGHVAKMTAEYDAEIEVCCAYPMTMVVAEEVVRQGYANAGRIDAHRPENIMFITSEQFAYAAAVNGMIVRDRPATNLFFGRFFAESLMLAETGYLTGAVQIAGTAEFTQLPFFIAACDYTLLGEELYAVSAYLSREPTLIAQLKAGDIVKGVIMVLIVVGVVAATLWDYDLATRLMP